LSEQILAFVSRIPSRTIPGKPVDAKAQYEELRIALGSLRQWAGLICVNDRADLAVLAAHEGLAPWACILARRTSAFLKPPPARLEHVHIARPRHEESEWAAVERHAIMRWPFRRTAQAGSCHPIGLEGLTPGLRGPAIKKRRPHRHRGHRRTTLAMFFGRRRMRRGHQ